MKLREAGMPLCTIQELKERAEAVVGIPDPIRFKDKIVGVVMYRNNTVIDVIRQIDENE
jgi:citrate lyase subunit alpha/citrate CoA-transferase